MYIIGRKLFTSISKSGFNAEEENLLAQVTIDIRTRSVCGMECKAEIQRDDSNKISST